MENIMRIETLTDAQTFVHNSGVEDWEWTGNASAEGFANWIRANCSEIDRENYDEELKRYLTSVGEDLNDYSL